MTTYKLGVCFNAPLSIEIDGDCIDGEVIDPYGDNDYSEYATSIATKGKDVDVSIRLYPNGYLLAEYNGEEVYSYDDDGSLYDYDRIIKEAVDAIEDRIKGERK